MENTVPDYTATGTVGMQYDQKKIRKITNVIISVIIAEYVSFDKNGLSIVPNYVPTMDS